MQWLTLSGWGTIVGCWVAKQEIKKKISINNITGLEKKRVHPGTSM